MNVLVTGSFDLLHSGHIEFLRQASRYGDLYVGIGSDKSIEKYKGRPPVCNENERLFMLRSVKYVKDAWINSGEGPVDFANELIEMDFLVVNDDQASEEKEELCEHLGVGYIVLKRIPYPGLPVRSTTSLR